MSTTATFRSLDIMSLESSTQVDLKDGHLIVTRADSKRKITLAELLAQCDASLPLSAEDQEWLNSPPVGLETL